MSPNTSDAGGKVIRGCMAQQLTACSKWGMARGLTEQRIATEQELVIRNNQLLGTSASLLERSALLVVSRSY